MRTLIVAAVSALFFATLVTELATRVWPDSRMALFVVTALAMFCAGLLNQRLARARAPAVATATDSRPTSGSRVPRAPAPSQRRTRPEPARPEPARSEQPRQTDNRGERARQERPRAPRPEEPRPAAGPREQGTVKWFNRTKGFGFIIRESGDEIFVHQRSIRPTGDADERRRPALQDGQSVSFVVAVREKGPQAEDVVAVAS
jgi:cold shock CspA family protein